MDTSCQQYVLSARHCEHSFRILVAMGDVLWDGKQRKGYENELEVQLSCNYDKLRTLKLTKMVAFPDLSMRSQIDLHGPVIVCYGAEMISRNLWQQRIV